MDTLPNEIINLIIRFASPRLTDEMKDEVKIHVKIRTELIYKFGFRYSYKCGDGQIRSYLSKCRDIEASRPLKSYRPFDYKYYYTKKELIDTLTDYYGGNKIPLISKLKNKRQIVQRIMSL